MEDKLTKELREFLEKKGVLGQFMNNAKNKAAFSDIDVDNTMDKLFVWSDSPEGHTFWSELFYEFYSTTDHFDPFFE